MKGPLPPTLDATLDEERMAGVLAPLVEARFGDGRFTLRCEHMKRRVVRYQVQVGEGDAALTWPLIGKLSVAPELTEARFRVHHELWEAGFQRSSPDRISVPEPIARLPELCLLLMEQVPGRALRHLVKKRRATVGQMERFADAVAKLHRAPVVPGPRFTVEDQLDACDPHPDVLAERVPAVATAVRLVMQRARRLDEHHGHEGFTFVHGDLHLGQVHDDGEQIWVLDLDEARFSDPAYDLAKVLHLLKRFTARNAELGATIGPLRDAFLARYGALMGWESVGRSPLHEGVIHLRRACKVVRLAEPGWEQLLATLVQQAVVCTETAERHDTTPRDLGEALALYDSSPGAS